MRPHEIDLRQPLADHPLNAGVAGVWLSPPQLHGGGRLWDLSPGGRYGALGGGATRSPGPTGFGAVALSDAGSAASSRVTLPAAVLSQLLAGDFTLVIDCEPSGWAGGFTNLVGGRASGGSNDGINFYLNTSGQATFLVVGGNSLFSTHDWAATSGRQVLAASRVVATSSFFLWRDGVQRSAPSGVTLSGTTAGAATFEVGGRAAADGGDASFAGRIHGVWAYPRALSAAELTGLTDQSRRGFPDLLRRVNPRRWLLLRDDPGGGGGGTTPITPAGSVAASGALTRAVSKALAGSATPAGALARLTAKPLAGSVTGAGSLAKIAAKPLAGSTTGTGAAAKAVAKPLAGSSTGAGSLGTVTVKLVAAAGSVTPAGVETHAVAKAVGGSTTATGATAKATAKALAGSETAAGVLAKRADKAIAGSATPSGALGAVRAALLAVAGSLTAAGGLVRAALKALAGLVTGTGSLSTSGGSTPDTGPARVYRVPGRYQAARTIPGAYTAARTLPTADLSGGT